MAPPSPRRSSRARPIAAPSQQSSASSSTSGRPERNTRSIQKPSSRKSTPSASLSSEPLDDMGDTLLSRRRTRGQDEDTEKTIRSLELVHGGEDLHDEEDEAVRCICGTEDYPGPPPADAPEAEFFLAHELTEDVTGFFVQCDVCKVWQHGACVGIFSAEASPDEYFCEQCRKDYHRILVAADGQKYSKYQPPQRISRPVSRSTSIAKEGTRSRSPKSSSSKASRANAASLASKRRSTMNSRDAAYDDEQLRQAIEASKAKEAKEGGAAEDGEEFLYRRPKRGRSDSDENGYHVKRQRTNSRSPTPAAEQVELASAAESDDDSTGDAKRARHGRAQQDKSERGDRELARQDAASKRKGRAERRRGDNSDLSDEIPLATSKLPRHRSLEPHNAEPLPMALPTPGTPPAKEGPVSHKKGARSNHKKTKGKNQYTKDRDAEKEESPARSVSRDIQKNTDEPASTAKAASAAESKSSARSKSALASKMSMTDMKRRVGAIMDFISRTQLDLAAEASQNGSAEASSGEQSPQKQPRTNGEGNDGTPTSPHDREFKELNCIEMMDVLTRDMVKWQNQYT